MKTSTNSTIAYVRDILNPIGLSKKEKSAFEAGPWWYEPMESLLKVAEGQRAQIQALRDEVRRLKRELKK